MLNIKQETETGKPVPGFEKLYEVSSHGRVSNYRKVMKFYKINSGYLCVKLTNGEAIKAFLVHRLVAAAFLPNPENKPEVNHIDGDKTNNHVSNLEWVTSAENKQHAHRTGLKIYNKPTTGKKLGKASQYFNVSWDKSRGKWNACVRHNSQNYFQKRFDCEIEAARHVNWILDELQLMDRSRNPV